jgi:hypothetical protein
MLTLPDQIVYYFGMKWIGTSTTSRRHKAICAAMLMLFLSGIYAQGILADRGCGPICCCVASAATMHHAADEETPPPDGCCDKIPTMPCNLKAGSPPPILVYVLTDASANGSVIVGPAGLSNLYHVHCADGVPTYSLDVPEKSQSPPLYLQKSSLLI